MTEHSEDTPLGPLAGAFPELANLTDADLEWAKQQWQRGLDRQLEIVSAESLTDWNRLDAMEDEDIDLDDTPEITPEMFAKAVVRREGQSLSQTPHFQSLLARSRESIAQGKGLSSDDFWQAVADHTARAAETEKPVETAEVVRQYGYSFEVEIVHQDWDQAVDGIRTIEGQMATVLE